MAETSRAGGHRRGGDRRIDRLSGIDPLAEKLAPAIDAVLRSPRVLVLFRSAQEIGPRHHRPDGPAWPGVAIEPHAIRRARRSEHRHSTLWPTRRSSFPAAPAIAGSSAASFENAWRSDSAVHRPRPRWKARGSDRDR